MVPLSERREVQAIMCHMHLFPNGMNVSSKLNHGVLCRCTISVLVPGLSDPMVMQLPESFGGSSAAVGCMGDVATDADGERWHEVYKPTCSD